MIDFKPLTDATEWQWVKSRTGVICVEDSQGIVAYRNGEIVAVCVIDTIVADSVHVHFAVDYPLVIKHGFFHEIARHVFEVLGKQRMFGLVPANNEKALKIDKNIGFKEVARVPHGYKTGVDLVVMKMEREECRFAPERREAA